MISRTIYQFLALQRRQKADLKFEDIRWLSRTVGNFLPTASFFLYSLFLSIPFVFYQLLTTGKMYKYIPDMPLT